MLMQFILLSEFTRPTSRPLHIVGLNIHFQFIEWRILSLASVGAISWEAAAITYHLNLCFHKSNSIGTLFVFLWPMILSTVSSRSICAGPHLGSWVVCDSVSPWTPEEPCQLPLSMGFSRQEYWSGLPCPPPGNLPNPGIEPRSPALQADSLLSETPGKPKNTEWVAYPLSRRSSWLRSQTRVPCIAGRFFTSWATREALRVHLCCLTWQDFIFLLWLSNTIYIYYTYIYIYMEWMEKMWYIYTMEYYSVIEGANLFIIVVLVCISLIISDVEHIFTCLLAICVSSLEKVSIQVLGLFFF